MKNLILKFNAIMLFTFPMLCNYEILPMNPSLLFCLVGFAMIIILLINRKRLTVDLRAFPYLVYILISASLAIMQSKQNSAYTLFVKLTLYTLTVIVFYVAYWQIVDWDFALRFYMSVALLATGVVIVQYLFGRMGRGFCLVVPGIRVAGIDNMMTNQIISNQMTANRYSSFFFEPAHQAQYVLPCLALMLFKGREQKWKDLAWAFFITLGLFCTTSMLGVLGGGIIWLFYVYTLLKSRKAKQWFLLLLLVPFLLLGVLYFISRDDLLTLLIKRLGALNPFSNDRTEGYRRMKYGWLCFAELNGVRKLFGVGYQNIGDYLIKSGLSFKLLGTNDPQYVSYTNGMAMMLISIGVVGTILNLRLFFFDALRSRDVCIYGLLLVWGIIMFTSNAFDDLGNINLMVLIMYNVYGVKKIRMKHTISLRIG